MFSFVAYTVDRESWTLISLGTRARWTTRQAHCHSIGRTGTVKQNANSKRSKEWAMDHQNYQNERSPGEILRSKKRQERLHSPHPFPFIPLGLFSVFYYYRKPARLSDCFLTSAVVRWTKPGKATISAGLPSLVSLSFRSLACVLLPLLSTPSSTINQPRRVDILTHLEL